MKNHFAFIIRLSIVNFFLYMLVVVVVANIGEKTARRDIQKQDNPVKMSPTVAPSSPVPTLSVGTPLPTEDLSIQVQNHNSRSDCWIVYEGHIYNMTSYLGSHPGGDDYILRYCGKDATEIFNRNHSEDSRRLLQQYLVQ